MPNNFAYFVLIVWPLISILLYRKLPTNTATFWTIVGGFLLLPTSVGIDLPMIPAFNKESIPIIMAFIGCRYIKKTNISFLPKAKMEKNLVILLLTLPFLTTYFNQEPVFNGKFWLNGLTYYDAISSVLNRYIHIAPFILGSQLFKSHKEQLLLFKLLVVACLFYSIPILWEIRLSPQLHTQIYGFFPHSFGQQMRQGGFRPVVFLGHGLLVAMFICISLGASLILWKNKIKIYYFSPILIILFLLTLLILSKTISVLIYGLSLFILIAWGTRYFVKIAIWIIALVGIMYPLLLSLDMLPYQFLVDLATKYSEDRAQSLGFRFFHEQLLLDHARNNFLFGWGGWGRGQFWDSVTDGYWIVILSSSGIIGFLAIFGLIFITISQSMKISSLIKNDSEKQTLLFHGLLVAIIMIDQLPNASMNASLWLIIGALSSRVYYLKEKYNN